MAVKASYRNCFDLKKYISPIIQDRGWISLQLTCLNCIKLNKVFFIRCSCSCKALPQIAGVPETGLCLNWLKFYNKQHHIISIQWQFTFSLWLCSFSSCSVKCGRYSHQLFSNSWWISCAQTGSSERFYSRKEKKNERATFLHDFREF